MSMLSYLFWPFVVMTIGLAGCFALKWSVAGSFSYLMTGAVFPILELSLSFDNVIVNANKLQQMTKMWRRCFLN